MKLFIFLESLQIQKFNQLFVQRVSVSLAQTTDRINTAWPVRYSLRTLNLFNIFITGLLMLLRYFHSLVGAACSCLRAVLRQVLQRTGALKELTVLTWLLFTV